MTLKHFSKTLIFTFLFSVIFLIGVSFGSLNQQAANPILNSNNPSAAEILGENQDVDFELFWDVWQEVKEKALKKPESESQLFYGAIKGLVASLEDPYSVFFDPEETKEFNQELDGAIEGIGAEIGIKKGILTIIAPLPNTPAAKSGLRSGDKVLAIDDESTLNMSLELAVKKIRGEKGSQVKLNILHKDADMPENIMITRAKIDIISVQWEKKESGIFYLELSNFHNDTGKRFRKAAENIIKQDPKALILDLRNNPGGYLTTAVNIASYWIEQGAVVKQKLADGAEEEYLRDDITPLLKDLKTIVLIDEGSASAAEILAGALQDYGKATIIGKTSFGKGSIQDYQEFQKLFKVQGALKLTVAEWLTPKGRSINEQGIEPDIKVEMTREDWEGDRDPQLEEVMKLLR